MIPYLPPLQALRAFEAAARLLSYTRAAQELSLTHGAISHHIARLEQDLGGIALFVREGQRMQLTDSGRMLVSGVRASLQDLSNAFANARAHTAARPASRVLTVSVLPSLAARWLVPRLAEFQAAHPDVDVALRPTPALAALDGRDGIDIAIRYGAGQWAGLSAARLRSSTVFAVCSPTLAERLELRSEADVLGAPLLRSPQQPWRPWFRAASLDADEPRHGPLYDDAGLLLQAAIAGQGIALARAMLASDDIQAGRLVRIGATQIEDDYSWFAVWKEPPGCRREDLEAFRDWLVEAAAEKSRPGASGTSAIAIAGERPL